MLRYGVILNDLVAYREALGQVSGDDDLAESPPGGGGVSKAKRPPAEEQAIVFVALPTGACWRGTALRLPRTLTGQQEAFVAFTLARQSAAARRVDRTVTGDAMLLGDSMRAPRLTRSVGEAAPFPPSVGSPASARSPT